MLVRSLALLEGFQQVGKGFGNLGLLEDRLVGVRGEENDREAEFHATRWAAWMHSWGLEHDVHEDEVGLRRAGEIESPPRGGAPAGDFVASASSGPGYRRHDGFVSMTRMRMG